MRNLICQKFCTYFKPHKDEAEKCLAFELLAEWITWSPALPDALASVPPGIPVYKISEQDQGAHGEPELPKTPDANSRYSFLVSTICSRCVFRAHGCDFAAAVPEAPPCGGIAALAALLENRLISETDIHLAWKRFLPAAYLRLAEHVSLRALETPHLYDRQADDLYEVNDEAFSWLGQCNGTIPALALQADPDFLSLLLTESLLACAARPSPRDLRWRRAPAPSLRYLELMLTERCNLCCRHCYLGETGERELPLDAVLQTLKEFQQMQGLRVLLSGGEPLLYSRWEELNNRLPEFELRFVLLSNGLLMTDRVIHHLKVHEVQLSLDGLESGHDFLRGPGTWKKTVACLENLQADGVEVSVATMVHQGNRRELAEMQIWLQKLGIREWNLDIPCKSGRLAQNQDICLDHREGARFLELGFGGSAHGAGGEYACGRHLAAVLADGSVAKCGLFGDQPLGRLDKGLENCWLRLHHVRLTELDCAACCHLDDCRGGCRYRAGRGLAPDPVMCARYGIDSNLYRR
jgi:radical SAM protein with 4Fe4S-binding SPASM domain